MCAEIKERQGQRHHNSSFIDISALVSKTYGNFGRHTSHYTEKKRVVETTIPEGISSIRRETQTDGLQSVRDSFRKRGFQKTLPEF